jgi:pyruvate kinase
LPLRRPEPLSLEEVFEQAIEAVIATRVAAKGDLILITAGLPLAVPGSTNLVKVHRV